MPHVPRVAIYNWNSATVSLHPPRQHSYFFHHSSKAKGAWAGQEFFNLTFFVWKIPICGNRNIPRERVSFDKVPVLGKVSKCPLSLFLKWKIPFFSSKRHIVLKFKWIWGEGESNKLLKGQNQNKMLGLTQSKFFLHILVHKHVWDVDFSSRFRMGTFSEIVEIFLGWENYFLSSWKHNSLERMCYRCPPVLIDSASESVTAAAWEPGFFSSSRSSLRC